VRRLATEYQAHLDFAGLDRIPIHGLHLTMQGVGFTDEVSATDIDAIAESVSHKLMAIEPIPVTLASPIVNEEAVLIPVSPAERLNALRAAVRAGIADIWGAGTVPEEADGWLPHMSLAYSNTTSPTAPVIDAINNAAVRPAAATVTAVQLIILGRDTHEYRWETRATVELGRPHDR
jgi:2'-5' RNA ligase